MILDKIKQYIDFKGVSISAFERSIGMANASFRNSLKNNGTIGCDKLERILNKYPDLNVKWLFNESEEMIIVENKLYENQDADSNAPIIENHDPVIMLIKQLSEKDILINRLNIEIRNLAENNVRLQAKLEGLTQTIQRIKETSVARDADTGHSAAW